MRPFSLQQLVSHGKRSFWRHHLKSTTSLLAAVPLLAASIAPPARAADPIPAFPGADGAAAFITGGRGGLVYHVTSLDGEINVNNSRTTPGTLPYGLNDANFKVNNVVQPRTIVFDVGGTIWLGRVGENVGWDTQDPISVGSNVTIAGQTAPGGINIMGGGLKVNGANAILRNLFIAPGYGGRRYNSTTGYADSYSFDSMNISAANVMVDHVSAVFSTDEDISADERATGVTVQYTNISQGQNYPQSDAEATSTTYTGHALGSLWQPGSNATLSVLHCLYAHQKARTPRVGTEAGKLTVAGVGSYNDFRNNVFYNWLSTGGSGANAQPSQNNFVNNFWLAGPGGDDPEGGTSFAILTKAGGTGIFSGADAANTKVFQSGNLKDINKDGDANDTVALANTDFGACAFQSGAYAQAPYYGLTDTAANAYSRVLNYVGANWSSRNTIDARIVNEVRTGTGKITALNDPTHGTEWNALLALRSAANGGIGGRGAYARPAGYDTDGDGMPDAWEIANGTNPLVADNNGDIDNDGYTNLEEYLNELSAFPAPKTLTFTGAASRRYELSGNWELQWEPSRYDAVQINSGDVTVDSPGQHAGAVAVAGTNASLTINGGALRVENTLTLGAGSAGGALVVNGGAVTLNGDLVRGGTVSGVLTLQGGTLDLSNHKIDIRVAEATNNYLEVFSGTLRNVAEINNGLGLLKSGSGTITLEGVNSYTGRTDVGGTGVFNVMGNLPGSEFYMDSPSTLSGSGVITAPAIINGTHQPGAGVGVQTFTNGITYTDKSHLQWQLLGNTVSGAGVNYDQVSASAVTVESGGALNPVLNSTGSAVNFTDPFWAANRVWTVVSVNLANGQVSGTFSNVVSSPDAGGRAATDYGTFTAQSGPKGIQLLWKPSFQTWQQTNFGLDAGNPAIAGATADPDGDGVTNQDEFLAGTNPRNGKDYLQTTGLNRASASAQITLAGRAGHVYALERSADLSTGSWAEVSRTELLAADQTVTLTDAAAPSSKAFYRARAITPTVVLH